MGLIRRKEIKTRNYVGYEHAGLLSRVTYSFVDPLVRLGVSKQIDENTSAQYLPSDDQADKLAKEFDAAYTKSQVRRLLHILLQHAHWTPVRGCRRDRNGW